VVSTGEKKKRLVSQHELRVGANGSRMEQGLTVRQSVVAEIVARGVGEVEEERCDRGRLVRGLHGVCDPESLEGDGHGDEDHW